MWPRRQLEVAEKGVECPLRHPLPLSHAMAQPLLGAQPFCDITKAATTALPHSISNHLVTDLLCDPLQ